MPLAVKMFSDPPPGGCLSAGDGQVFRNIFPDFCQILRLAPKGLQEGFAFCRRLWYSESVRALTGGKICLFPRAFAGMKLHLPGTLFFENTGAAADESAF